MNGYLLHITKEYLELTTDGIEKYYSLCGVNITSHEAEKLYSTTEGWISALYLLLLNYQAEGRFMTTDSIGKLVENAIYKPLSEDIKSFLIKMCIFDRFSPEQAVFIFGNETAELYLDDIIKKNAFVNFDVCSGTYHIHHIYSDFLQLTLRKKDADYQRKLYKKAGDWCLKKGEYLAAMHYFYTADAFDNLLSTVELDKGKSFALEHKEMIIQYFMECPLKDKQQHLVSLLVYAMAFVKFNEMLLFQTACEEVDIFIQSSNLDPDSINSLKGELELLKSFTRYNDIMGMMEHHKKACTLMKGTTVFMNTKGNWTFGSPSVLYMFYRQSGKLEQEVYEMKEAMPYYYQLTNGHGMGAEYVMEAEWYFYRGDYENAEIVAHKAFVQANTWLQPSIVICALFLQVRLALIKGDYACVLNLFNKIHEEMEHNKAYALIHTIDMCYGFVNACLRQDSKIPGWLVEGHDSSEHLFFPARAFSNIIYGRVLLIKGEYLKLLGHEEHFKGIASVYPSILANIYTMIYMAAASDRIARRNEAVEFIKKALELATPDRVYMPFVENSDYVKPLLDELYLQGLYSEDIKRILALYKDYHKAMQHIIINYFTEDKPKLTEREKEVALLASEGYSNRKICEKLYISDNTVKTQLKSVFDKLGVNSRLLLKQYFR